MPMTELAQAAFGLLFTIGIVCGLTPHLYRRGSGKWIDDVGAPIDPDVREIVHQARGRRLAYVCAGGLGGLCLGYALNVVVFAEQPGIQTMIAVASMVIGVCAGLIFRAFTAALRADSGSVRVAHATAPRVNDVIRRKAQVLVLVEVITATIICLVIAMQPMWDGPGFTITGSGPLWVAAALIPFSYVVTEVLVRRLLQRPTPGASPRSIVWHDALRREMAVDISTTPSAVVLLAAMVVYSWTGNPWADLPFSTSFYLTACMMPGLFQQLHQPKPAVVALS